MRSLPNKIGGWVRSARGLRVWNTPPVSEVNQYGSTLDGKNYCIGTWADPDKDEQEAIWSLKYHPF